jgi:hypothetical protein
MSRLILFSGLQVVLEFSILLTQNLNDRRKYEQDPVRHAKLRTAGLFCFGLQK